MATVSANIIEVEVDGQKFTKVSYSKKEEIANCVTHGIAALFYVAGFIYMMTISFDARTYWTSVLTCLTGVCVFSISTIYHAVQDTKKKFYWRKADHSDIPFLVLGCASGICLLLSDHVYNYVALGLCVGLAILSDIFCIISVDRFKVITMVLNFVIATVMLVAVIINFNLVPQAVKYVYLAGAITCTVGSILFGIKIKYMHAIFHVFITAGTILCYVATVLLIQNYVAF